MNSIAHIVDQHAEEAAFLWILRDRSVRSPHYRLRDLADLDGRLEAHLDGLRIAGGPGREICEQELSRGEPGEIFAAASIARDLAPVLEIAAKPELARPVVSALGWMPWEAAKLHIDALLKSKKPAERRIGIAACAVHRRDPGPALESALRDDDPLLRARALKAVGELGRVDLADHVRGHRKERTGAFALLLLTGNGEALRSLADPHAVRGMPVGAANGWLETLPPRPALVGAGALGDPARIPWLLERMKTPALARVAGEAFSMITGADLAHENLEGTKPDGFEAGPTDDPADENVDLDPDEDLPWPDLQEVGAWWAERSSQFTPGRRYLAGRPLTPEDLTRVLVAGYQRQRIAAAIELAILSPKDGLFEVRAPGFRQRSNPARR